MKTPDQIDTLILVHPFAAPRGADLKLRLWRHLLDSWSGPLHILQGPDLDSSASPAANTLGAVIDTIVDERAAHGEDCLRDARSAFELAAALDAIISLIEPGAHITLTGAFAEDSVLQAAQQAHQSGFEVSIDESALWRDEIDARREAQDKERLKRLMAALPPPED